MATALGKVKLKFKPVKLCLCHIQLTMDGLNIYHIHTNTYHICTYMHTHIYGTCGAIVTIVGNWHDDLSSNSGLGCLHFT